MRRLRGLKSLVHDAVDATTVLVGEGHDSVARTTVRFVSLVPPLTSPVRTVDRVRRVVTHSVLGSIRGVNRLVEEATDAGLDAAERAGLAPPDAAPVVQRADAQGSAAWVGDALLGAVNGIVGDHLRHRDNDLDLGMSLRWDAPALGPRVVVLVHGLATTEWSWSFGADRHLGDPAANFGVLLERDLGFQPVFARYNTGCHVSENGRSLAAELERLVEAWPIEELVLVGHSMGGLVIRAATLAGGRWAHRVRRVVCLGSPHRGAPLERLAHVSAAVLHAVDHPGTRIPAALLRGRSVGIKDLRHGDVHEAAWADRDLDELGARDELGPPLVDGIAYAFIAGSLTDDAEHPAASVLGDLLVPVRSAEGPGGGGPRPHTARFGGVAHHELQVHPGVYEEVRRFCAGELDG